MQRKFSRRIKVFTPGVLLGLTFEPNNIAGTSPKRVVMEAINPKPIHTTTAGDSPLHTTTSSSLDIALRDPSLLRGCTAGTLLNDCSSVFSSNILGKDEVSIMHKNTAQVDKLDDFVSHSWRTDRWTKWGALLLHFNGDAALAAMLTVSLSSMRSRAFSIIPTIFPACTRSTWTERRGSTTKRHAADLQLARDLYILPQLARNPRMAAHSLCCAAVRVPRQDLYRPGR